MRRSRPANELKHSTRATPRRATRAGARRTQGGERGLGRILETLVSSTANTGQAFFDSLALCLGQVLGARWVLVGELTPDSQAIVTRGFAADGQLQPSVTYGLAGTPCENVISGDLCEYTNDVQARFPDDAMLREIGARSYLAVPLRSANQETLGLLAVLHDGEIRCAVSPHALLQLFATRAAGELERARSEHKVRAHEGRLRLALEAAQMGAWEWSREHGRVGWSERENLVCGFAPGTVIRTFADYLERAHPEDRTSIEEAINDGLAGVTRKYLVEHRVAQPDGSYRWIEGRGKAFLDERGQPARLAGTLMDITERRRTEAEARANEERWRRFSEAAFEGIGISRAGRVLDANEQLANLLGYRPDELLGCNVMDLVAPESRDEVRRREGTAAPYEHLLLRKDGSRVPVEVQGRNYSVGDYQLRITAVHDLSSRKQLEAELRNAANEWNQCFDALLLGLLLVDASGLVRRANRQALEWWGGGDFDDLLGRHVRALGAHEPWRALDRLLMERAEPSGNAASSELRDAATGHSWSVSAHPLVRGQGEPAWTILLFADVTETARLREALVRQEALASIGSLVAGVAHEVRTPLFSISASVDAFVSGSEQERAEVDALLRAQVRRLSRLMSDLLDYGRPPQPTLRRGGLRDVVQRAVLLCAEASRQGGVSVEIDLPATLPEVERDPGRLEQAFQNLIANAIQHAPAGSVVRIGSPTPATPDAWVTITVEDQGPGLPGESLLRVFEPFYSRRRGGTGLGLAIVQRIVEAHGGTVSAGNRPGRGAVFTVQLPVPR